MTGEDWKTGVSKIRTNLETFDNINYRAYKGYSINFGVLSSYTKDPGLKKSNCGADSPMGFDLYRTYNGYLPFWFADGGTALFFRGKMAHHTVPGKGFTASSDVAYANKPCGYGTIEVTVRL